MMGIFVIETKDNWDRVLGAMRTWRHKMDSEPEAMLYGTKDERGRTAARRYFEELEVEVKEALAPVRIDVDSYWNQVAKLLMANNVDRAIKLTIAVRSDRQLRWGWALLLGILLLPFRLIYAVIRMVAP